MSLAQSACRIGSAGREDERAASIRESGNLAIRSIRSARGARDAERSTMSRFGRAR
jgi:hypothetical protein